MNEPIQLTSILGSATRPGRLHRAVDEALNRGGDGIAVESVDLGQVEIGFADGRPLDQLDDDAPRVVAALERADAVLLATPVYRGSLTGALKNLLDLTPVDALQGKPVLIVAMGATDHHYLGASRHLRDILAFFGALPLPTDVYLTSRDFTDGEPGSDAAEQLDLGIAALTRLAEATAQRSGQGPDPLFKRLTKSRR